MFSAFLFNRRLQPAQPAEQTAKAAKPSLVAANGGTPGPSPARVAETAAHVAAATFTAVGLMLLASAEAGWTLGTESGLVRQFAQFALVITGGLS